VAAGVRDGRALVQVLPAFRGRVSVLRLRRLALAALAVGADPLEAGAERGRSTVGVLVADDETVRDLNRQYRGLDEVTDVLAFSPVHAGPYGGAAAPPAGPEVVFPQVADEAAEIGDVVVAYPQAARQAGEGGRPVADELALLVVHGVLHLLGYDHAEPHEQRVMQAKERAAIARAGTPRGRRGGGGVGDRSRTAEGA
jgi:probable rRNA maturation factor